VKAAPARGQAPGPLPAEDGREGYQPRPDSIDQVAGLFPSTSLVQKVGKGGRYTTSPNG